MSTTHDADRELLELAAKVAEMKASENDGVIYAGFGSREWNPLADDGDAFRLAVKMRIDVAHARDYVVSGLGTADSMRRENGDDCAATRRAIVRAAAEIGRAMP